MATIAPEAAPNRRWAELALLVPALALGIYAYVQVGLNTSGVIPANTLRDSVVFTLLTLGLHLLLRWRAPYADPIMLPLAVALGGIGLAMIARIDIAEQLRGNAGTAANRQLVWMILGMVLAAAVLLFLRDHRTLRRFTYTAMVVALGLLLLPLVPGLGLNINGATIWISVGPFTFQPAELAKICLAVFFAGYLVTNRDTLTLAGPRVLGLQLPRLRDMGPIVLAWIVSIGVLVQQSDLGTSLLLFGMFVAMLYVATERLSWVIIGALLFGGGAVAAAVASPYVLARFTVWLHAFDPEIYNRDPGGSGQLVRGLFGMASGGLFGTGWGLGHPILVPYANSDFIVASLGEELGLTGLLALLLCYLLLAQRGLRTAIGVRDGFGKLLASGLAFTIAFQCFVVVGGVTRLIPLTGLTMPFLAAGGSSLVSNWIVLALLLRISDAARRPAVAAEPVPDDLPGVDDAAADDGERVTARGAGSADDADGADTAVTEVVRTE
ncbi:cell cycle protein [Beutenbergia cavernae DSM 12333]|uniref:Cell cycle protein n=1 Tax=Beutenbergia cavernae (strain ATCC BAA-8 / DSM 12333 / CCUG 43141 / JCM 11478 / NBRC 16432 / NCIMB 13614 / HKI 0122) TaxID=471853 RepID=C5BUS1_BEUC1|nr:FtsW/RodA/SpoVE family cell cycle protein [Beutenbergia cavernae]ACQ78295.1 cell cycle protein [Beutenbergia cavernae DSM 12333]